MHKTILQPGEHLSDAEAHYLPAEPQNVFWGRLPCAADAPVLRLSAGETAVVDTLSHEGLLEDQGSDPLRYFTGHGVEPEQVLQDAVDLVAARKQAGARFGHLRNPEQDGPHVVTGPIHVDGAEPGDLLKITVVGLERRVPYGVISNRHSRGALPGEFPRGPQNVSVFAAVDETGERPQGTMAPAAGADRTVRFELAPFLGTMGVAASADQRPHSVPPGLHGGNIDIKMLTETAALYLPVQVPGALAYVGDPHFAQGDGEVALTAMEASLRARLRFDVVPREEALQLFGEQIGPLAETSEFLIPTGLDEDLDIAVQKCVRNALTLLQARWGLDAEHAYAYLSAATDFNISQVVDVVKGVHGRVRRGDFSGLSQ
ncbi:acetamidase/formamidase family protein [Nesterenkonia flava]|uniref:Acetamidase/formamidase family protein n=1 Tax=Nesterenkonia flava TaxID=469799 RepID=A0ABU1FVS6_9MICC|nr:acetamidase/formamidase family protein [Nesterenkonia flava]MDR5712771.1 acetamidase/formamidase family protein [Nesterenkonia flava]